MSVRIGEVHVSTSSRGVRTFRVEMWHPELKKHRMLQGKDLSVLQRKAALQTEQWNIAWAKAEESLRRSRQKQKKQDHIAAQKESAENQTTDAVNLLRSLENLLLHTLDVDDSIDWDLLKDHSPFKEPAPLRPMDPPAPVLASAPAEPQPQDEVYQPRLGFLDKIISSRRSQREAEAQDRFQSDHAQWVAATEAARKTNEQRTQEHQAHIARIEKKYTEDRAQWLSRKAAFLQSQHASNQAVDSLEALYNAKDPEAIVQYCDMVLANSQYPDCLSPEWELQYNPDTEILIVDYSLPDPEALPTLCEVKYVQSRDDFTEKHISKAEAARRFDSIVYQIALRTIHELLEADKVNAIKALVFNGVVSSIDPATGHRTTSCILSIQVNSEEFLAINLARIDPKICFKSLKGVGSSKLHSLTAVAPIIQITREDARFVLARDIADTLDDGVNLASMDWEDFEHLVRELFEQEFASSGGEVKVTQASRDGGVDAIAFDPDPIRGGKIVIQAKRYTRTVGVAAVRDLYGTVMNEGANRGILVTTSDFGPDAYSFAKDKPITLLSGANLLHLLERHGRKAKIDLAEARREMK